MAAAMACGAGGSGGVIYQKTHERKHRRLSLALAAASGWRRLAQLGEAAAAKKTSQRQCCGSRKAEACGQLRNI